MANRVTKAGIVRFLEALGETGSVREALRLSGTPRASMYRKRRRSKAFAKQWEEAIEVGLDLLRDEAVQRALFGTEKPVFHQGVRVGSVRVCSDALLMFLLRAHQPQRYREPALADMAAQRRDEKAMEKALALARKEGADHALGELLASIDGQTRGIHQGSEAAM